MSKPEEELFDNAIKSLEATIASAGVHLKIDTNARRIYARQIKAMSEQLRRDVASGKLTWMQAAQQAQTTRNVIMQLMRSRTTPVARATAQKIKAEGRGLNTLIAEKTQKLYGKTVDFAKLSASKQNGVFAEIVASAGRAGALAGLACGPGAPVCVTIGAFAGGALAAFSAGFIW